MLKQQKQANALSFANDTSATLDFTNGNRKTPTSSSFTHKMILNMHNK